MTPQVELQSYEILARFWVKAPTQEVAETTINDVLVEAKKKLAGKLDFTIQVTDVQ